MKKKILSLVSLVIMLGTSLLTYPAYAATDNQVKLQAFEGSIMETEPNNSFEEALPVNEHDQYSGKVSINDQDFYKITVTNKGMLSVFDGVFGEQSYVILTIYSEDGEVISSGEVSNQGDFPHHPVVEPGTYYFKMEAAPSITSDQEYYFSYAVYEGYINRLSGVDRYETAVTIAYRWAALTDNIILATGQDFPDALAAGPLSVQMRAPILLTRQTQLPDSVKEFIKEAMVKKVTIIGGTGVISQDVENYLKNVMGLQVERIAGSNRFDTAAKIANRLENVYGEKVAYVVNGRNFPDALSISPVAASEGAPILLTESDSIPQATLNILNNYDEFFVIGGTKAVSDNIANKLGSPIRISGNNRYETSAIIAEFFDYAFDDSHDAYIATGTNFADALTGVPVAVSYPGPLLLTPSNYLYQDAKDYFETSDKIWFTIFGGKNAVSEQVENELRSLF